MQEALIRKWLGWTATSNMIARYNEKAQKIFCDELAIDPSDKLYKTHPIARVPIQNLSANDAGRTVIVKEVELSDYLGYKVSNLTEKIDVYNDPSNIRFPDVAASS